MSQRPVQSEDQISDTPELNSSIIINIKDLTPDELPSRKWPTLITRRGYVAKADKETHSFINPKSLYGLRARKDIRIISWSGRLPIDLVTEDGTTIAHGFPLPQSFSDHRIGKPSSIQAATMAMSIAGLTASTKYDVHRRGHFTAVNGGISFGGGQQKPSLMTYPRTMLSTFEGLRTHEDIQKIARFQSDCLSACAPRLASQYEDTISDLERNSENLQRNFPLSCFSACTFNLGPRSVTYPHRDSANYSGGWCAITALGDFDPRMGGHLILWSARIAIEFPPGATILIPSALICHSNVPINPTHTRFSITQYTAGQLLSWNDNGGMTCIDANKEEGHDEHASRIQSMFDAM